MGTLFHWFAYFSWNRLTFVDVFDKVMDDVTTV